jgi:hypothetical protein
MESSYPATLDDRLKELEQIRNSLFVELNNCSSAACSSQQGRWSVAEIAYHLHLTEKSITMVLQNGLASMPRHERLPDERIKEEWELITKFAIDRETKFNAPAYVVPKNAPSLEESHRLLEASRAELIKTVSDATLDDLASISLPHPVKSFGNISGIGWVSLIGWHEKRHTEQIKDVKAAVAQV